jgi:hypothetical protein
VHNAQGQRTATPNRHIIQNTQYTAGQIVQNRERAKKQKICVLTLDFYEILAIMSYKKSATHQGKTAKKEFSRKSKKVLDN